MNKLLLIGPGNIGLDYVKVLQSIDIQFEVIGRSPKNDWIVPVYEHGIKKYLENLTEDIDFAIVSTNENQLGNFLQKNNINSQKGIEDEIIIMRPAKKLTNITWGHNHISRN